MPFSIRPRALRRHIQCGTISRSRDLVLGSGFSAPATLDVSVAWADQIEPCITQVYAFDDDTPTVTLLSEETCFDLSGVDGEWGGPVERPA